MHVLISPTKTFTRIISYFPAIRIGVFYPWLQLYIQTEPKVACYHHFKYFQLETRKKNYIQLQVPLSSIVLMYTKPVQWRITYDMS
jgi:hypothetical protein